LGARGPRGEGIAEVLGLAGHLAVPKLHDADRVGRLAVVGEDKLGDPEVGGAHDAPHREALLVGLGGARRLDVAPAANALARLRVLEHGVLAVDLVLDLEVAGVERRPVEIQRRSS
jgi:hypothetical protein